MDMESRNVETYLEKRLNITADYAAEMFGSGANTLRVMRCTHRVAVALGIELEISNTYRHFTITAGMPHGDECLTKVVAVPHLPVSFERTANLSTLSWQAYDERLSAEEVRSRLEAIKAQPRWQRLHILLLISVANAAFCYLFGGDLLAMAIVGVATAIGFALKNYLLERKLNTYIVFVIAAFAASIVASVSVILPCTAATALATSPLYLVPGVPLINGIIDIVEGHILVGISRLVDGMMLIFCIALGLSATLMIVKGSLI